MYVCMYVCIYMCLEPKAAKANAQKLLNDSDSDFENEVLASSHSKKGVVVVEHAPNDNSKCSSSTSSTAATATNLHDDDSDSRAIKPADRSWTCGTCTLINETNDDFCEACGVEKCDI